MGNIKERTRTFPIRVHWAKFSKLIRYVGVGFFVGHDNFIIDPFRRTVSRDSHRVNFMGFVK